MNLKFHILCYASGLFMHIFCTAFWMPSCDGREHILALD